jgi:hypothetical protein
MSKVGLHQLAQSGATDGQAPLWSDASGEYVPGAVGGGGSSLGWVNLLDSAYGVTGDDSTDDTSAANAAIAAINAQEGGVFYCPKPSVRYKITGALDPIQYPTLVLGDGCADPLYRRAATEFRCTSGTADLFTFSDYAHGSEMRGLSLLNGAASTPTAGSGVKTLAGDGIRYENLSIKGFWINMDVEDGGEWYMDRVFFYDPVKYGLKVQHIDLPDGGDMGIENCQFISGSHAADAAIRWETGGGLRLVNFKVNARSGAKFAVGLDAVISSPTAVLVVGEGSIENVSGPAIKGRLAGSGTFVGATIGPLEIAYYSSTSASAIDIDGWDGVTVNGITALAPSGGSTGSVVKLANVDHGCIGAITNDGFAADVSKTSCTDIREPITSDRQVATDSTLTGGGDLSADRTLGVNTTAETERIQDVVGAMVVAGTNVTATYNDPAGTLTIAASGGSSTSELLMQDGVTGPPVPIENEARSDWLYQG